jgi:bifunctional non-homologous end joining protein LigD
MPKFVAPQLARVIDAPPTSAAWVHEIKLDGYRMQLRVQNGRAVLLTRKELDWSHRFPEIVQEAGALPDCILDGEVCALDSSGISNFAQLQAALSDQKTGDLVYFVFDLMYLEREGWREQPLTERKAALEAVLSKHLRRSTRIHYVEHFQTPGTDMLEAACKMGLEGIISKRADAPYKSGRGDDWTKSKCRGGQEVVIGGWWGDSNKLRSLLVGAFQNGEFVYMGRVGTGYNQRSAGELLRKLKPIERPQPAFAKSKQVPRARGIHWVEPKVVAEIEFSNITTDGILRQASYKGMREDKSARNVVPEPQPAAEHPKQMTRAKAKTIAQPKTASVVGKRDAVVAGITITNSQKVLWPATEATPAITKLDLARYYEAAAPRILTHIAGRPLSMVRAPDGIEGEHFFQRHVFAGAEKYLNPVHLAGRKEVYVSIDTKEGVVALAQAAVLEFHPWGSKPGEPDTPQRLIFDLDPAPDVDFDTVIEAAKDLRKRLEDLGMTAFVKTTGGKGIHVATAIRGTPKTPLSWPDAKNFSRDVCLAMERDEPDRYVTNMSKKVRGGKIFLDFLRNDRMATAVGAWSPRARPGAHISMPLPWAKLRKGPDPAAFNVANAKAVLKSTDPWKDLDTTGIALEAARRKT